MAEVPIRSIFIEAEEKNYDLTGTKPAKIIINPQALMANMVASAIRFDLSVDNRSGVVLPYQIGQTFEDPSNNEMVVYKGLGVERVVQNVRAYFTKGPTIQDHLDVNLFEGNLNSYLQPRNESRLLGDLGQAQSNTLCQNPYGQVTFDAAELITPAPCNAKSAFLSAQTAQYGSTVTSASQNIVASHYLPLHKIAYWAKNQTQFPLGLMGELVLEIHFYNGNRMLTLAPNCNRIEVTRTSATKFTLTQDFSDRNSLRFDSSFTQMPIVHHYNNGTSTESLTVTEIEHDSATGEIILTVDGTITAGSGDRWIRLDRSILDSVKLLANDVGVHLATWGTDVEFNRSFMSRIRQQGMTIPYLERKLVTETITQANVINKQFDILRNCVAIFILFRKQFINSDSNLHPNNRENILCGRDGMSEYTISIDGNNMINVPSIRVGRANQTDRCIHNYMMKRTLRAIGQKLKRYDSPLLNYNQTLMNVLDQYDAYNMFMIPVLPPTVNRTQKLNVRIKRETGNFTINDISVAFMTVGQLKMTPQLTTIIEPQ